MTRTTRTGRLLDRLAGAVGAHGVLAIGLCAGLVLVVTLAALAGEVYEAVVEEDGVAVLDRPLLAVMVAARTPEAVGAVSVWTDVGGPVGMPLLTAGVALATGVAWRRWTPVVLLAVTAAGSLLMTVAGKSAVGRSRPPEALAVPPYESSWSFPSGHALNATAIAGVVAYLLVRHQRSVVARTLTVLLAAAFAGTMGLSRIYLGHHWFTDVLVAWVLGLAWAALVVTVHRLHLAVRRRSAQRRPAT